MTLVTRERLFEVLDSTQEHMGAQLLLDDLIRALPVTQAAEALEHVIRDRELGSLVDGAEDLENFIRN